MRNLTDTIKAHEDRLDRYDLSPTSRVLAQDTLYHLKWQQRMLIGKKFCYRYGHVVIESCEACQDCPKPEDLAWNEEEND